ncbi:MAG: phosphoribosylamine--glycine ligase [Candidatus Liptonbacteria bacterium]|nr:phosphoribosylamine--glycine ligase [Candidatus Liptonbacteria bacterium]
MSKTILVVGNYAREHALAWKLSQSPKVGKLYIAPGNGGTGKAEGPEYPRGTEGPERSRRTENVPIAPTDIPALAQFVQGNKVDVTIVASDDPLAMGIVDAFEAKGLKIFGPTKAAAQIEASKAFAKKLMKENNIPTAAFETIGSFDDALAYVKAHALPVVIKADGLALGKGVVIAATLEEAEAALKKIMVEKIFGESGSRVVVEEFLQGEEFSVHAFTDGKTFKLFPPSQDHKAIFEGDKGPNTGGIGTIAPLSWVSEADMRMVSEKVVTPALEALARAGTPFRGLLYPGLMMTNDGPNPVKSADADHGVKTIEFNSRFGDPECESYMRLLKTDLLDIVEACIDGTLEKVNIEWHPGFACCVILCSGGYPGAYEKGKEITGIEEAEKMPDVIVFHAGTKVESNKLVTSGGRVLGVTATGETLEAALKKAYEAAAKIHFDGMYYRKDIGAKALCRVKVEP